MAPLPLHIRGYRPADREEVWKLHTCALQQVDAFIAGHGPWDDDLKDIPAVYDNAGGVFLIAELQGKIAGMGALRRVDDTTAELKRMRVQPALQNQGISTMLLQELESKAKEMGYKRLILDTSTKQQAALHLYAKHGYRETKRGQLGGLEVVWMEKIL